MIEFGIIIERSNSIELSVKNMELDLFKFHQNLIVSRRINADAY